MLTTILSIKFCLLTVFLIGLLTGYFYVRRVIKEEYLPIEKNFTDTIKQNEKEIKKYKTKIENNNQKIATMRDEMKRFKEQTTILDEDLLNVESLYSKQSIKNEQLQDKLEEQKKIKQSLEKEYQFYIDSIEKQDKLPQETNKLQQDIQQLEVSINDLKDKYNNLEKEILEDEKQLNKIKESSNLKKLESNRINHEIEKLNQEIEKNPDLSNAIEIDEIKKRIEQYKQEILNLK